MSQLQLAERDSLTPVTTRFAFRANEYYLSLINGDDPADPIRRIVMPGLSELDEYGYRDPSQEASNYPTRGCQHKYPQTALLLVSEVCDAYCRFCFRKRLFQPGNTEASLDISAGLAYIREHPEITNVLLTGGDPLTLSTRRLGQVLSSLREIEHVRIIRVGTKTLAFNPFRVTDDPELIDVLTRYSHSDRRIYVMAHFDHPRELTVEARRAIALLQEAGCAVVHQCPLLRGINDNVQTLADLWEGLSHLGVTPYYLFQNRPVFGNAGFVVPLAEGYTIYEGAKARVSGLAKRVRYVMSHDTGKVEVLAVQGGEIFLKYHQARYPEDEGRFLRSTLPPDAAWLDDLLGLNRMNV